jgi:phosphohistidine phosphatase SixA
MSMNNKNDDSNNVFGVGLDKLGALDTEEVAKLLAESRYNPEKILSHPALLILASTETLTLLKLFAERARKVAKIDDNFAARLEAANQMMETAANDARESALPEIDAFHDDNSKEEE